MSDTENKDANSPPKEDKEENEEPMQMDGKKENDTEIKNDVHTVDSPPSSEPSTPNKTNTNATTPPKRKKTKPETPPEEEEELPLGLLERPVVITSGKRERKKTERLPVGEISATKTKKKMEIPEGSGTKLGACPRIEQQITKTKSANLKTLHKLLYNRPGQMTETKRNIRQFCGFDFGKGDKEYDQKYLIINKLTIAQLKSLCIILDLDRGGVRADLMNRILEFLLKPVDSGKPLPKPKRRGSGKKSKKGGEKRKRESKKEGKKSKKKSKGDIELEDDDDDEEDDEEKQDTVEDESEEEERNESEEESEAESEEEPPKKKKKTTSKKETPKKVKKEKAKSKENGKKEKSTPKKKKAKVVDSDDDSSEDEPLGKKVNEPPNNNELKGVIEKILDGADLEEVTMKTVVKQVYAKYPSFDLTDRKDFIKSTVKQIIS